MPYKRYARRKRSYKKKSRGITKKRMYKSYKRLRAYAKPDGMVSEKFVYTLEMNCA